MNAIASSILVLAGCLLFVLAGERDGGGLGVAIIILGFAVFGHELGWWRYIGQIVRDLAAEFNEANTPARRPPSRPEPPMPGDSTRQNDR